MANRKVRVNARYRYEPVLMDRADPPYNAPDPGEIVTVVNLYGCPKANTMGMCYIALDGQFAGLVCTNSLQPLAVPPYAVRKALRDATLAVGRGGVR